MSESLSALLARAEALRHSASWAEAEALCRQALSTAPAAPEALFLLARVLRETHRLPEAIELFQRCAALPAPPTELAVELGMAFQEAGDLEQAERWYLRSLKEQVNPAACSNLAVILQQRSAFEPAEQLLRLAIRLQPAFEQAFCNLGNVLLDLGRFEEARLAQDHAIDLRPGYHEAYYNRSFPRLAQGDLPGGFSDYEHRWHWQDFPCRRPDCPQPEWTGQELKGRTLLVYTEQGLGDSVQFCRYLRLLAGQGARLLLACPQPLRRLFGSLPAVSELVEPGKPLAPFDFHVALMSLPHRFQTCLETIPADVPYLPLPGAGSFSLAPSRPGRLRVGLVWAGGARHAQDQLRSMRWSQMQPLLTVPQCEFFSLQVGPQIAELSNTPPALRVEDVGSRLRDLTETAAVIGQLDLVISVDTCVAHLAGALGKPVWTLLPRVGEWRWLLGREDSPWYPTMRLFRQKQAGDWSELIERVRGELDQAARDSRLGALASFAPPKAPEPGRLPPAALKAAPQTAPPAESPLFISVPGHEPGSWGPFKQGLLQALSGVRSVQPLVPDEPAFLSVHLPGPLLTTLSSLTLAPDCPARGSKTLGFTAIEGELTEQDLENARRFDLVLAGSRWCLERLRQSGVAHSALLPEGVDTRLFCPGPEGTVQTRPGAFVLFSGGPLSWRKGQDLVLSAFQILSRKYPDMLLVTRWENLDEPSLQTLAASSLLRFEWRGRFWSDQLAHLCALNDIAPGRVVAMKPCEARERAGLFQTMHLGLFPSRCEGATDFELMEFMACGRPAVVSFHSGHCDLVNEQNAFLLRSQRTGGPAPRTPLAWWSESSVEEIVALVEYAYQHRDRLEAKGRAAARTLQLWDWAHTAQTLLPLLA